MICKTLTSFRYYKDIFLCRVMELPERNSTQWKSKFIDRLPTLFVERVRRPLEGIIIALIVVIILMGNL
uniref:Putative ovule protein n=1 Tax=Solanum chacoense TaxID=4108 RepID=A0A0V0HVJ3_SOLCH